jgi:hypothetical protein
MRIPAGGHVLFTGQHHQCPEFDRPQGPLPAELEVLLTLIDGAERRRRIQGRLNHSEPRARLRTPIKSALLALWVMAAIVHTTNNARAQSLEGALIKSVEAEVHSVVVDMPRVITLPPASPHAWNTFWDNLPSSIESDEQGPAHQPAQTSREPNKFEFLKVNSTANILSRPSASADTIGIAYAGAEVQVASRDSGWVKIIDSWSWGTGWMHSKFLAPLEMILPAPVSTLNAANSRQSAS